MERVLRRPSAGVPQRLGHDRMIAHQHIDAAQIAAGTNRPRIFRRQFVEELGFNDPLHVQRVTRGKWQVT